MHALLFLGSWYRFANFFLCVLLIFEKLVHLSTELVLFIWIRMDVSVSYLTFAFKIYPISFLD